MVYQREDGGYNISGSLPEQLAQRVETVVQNNPELSEGQLIREGLREALEQYE